MKRWILVLIGLGAAALTGCMPPRAASPPRGTSATTLPAAASGSPSPPEPDRAASKAPAAFEPIDPCPPPPPEPDRVALATGLEPSFAGMIHSPMTEFTAPSARFLRCGTFYAVEHLGRYHPTYFHVAYLPDRPARMLRTSAELAAFGREAGLVLDTEERRTAYVRAFLGLDDRYQELIESVRDFRFTIARDLSDPGVAELLNIDPTAPIAEEIAVRRRIEDEIGKTLKPLRLPGTAPWRGEIHVIKKPRTLVRLNVTLTFSGDIGLRETTLATGVPVMVVVP